MGKFQLKRPRIISKHFDEVGSHVDNVSKSLQGLVFAYSNKVDKALQKKHILMAISTMVLVLVVGNFISPKGKADVVTFYPETCLGGWLNPNHAEKAPETTSNTDPDLFTNENSAVLHKNTHADIYCGNFTGTFNDATHPNKIVISLALTNKGEATTTIATTTLEEVGAPLASSTDVTSSSTDALILSTSTSSTTIEVSNASPIESSSTTVQAEESTTTPNLLQQVAGTMTDIISNLLGGSSLSAPETDTIVVPPPPVESTPEPAPTVETPPVESAPTSFMDSLMKHATRSFFTTVYAQEEAPAEPQVVVPLIEPVSEQVTAPVATTTGGEDVATSTADVPLVASSTEMLSASTTSSTTEMFASTTDAMPASSSTEIIATEEETQNNFLEVLYSFDGVTWTSLGELNEISMKYRTFEIPLTASSTWTDLSQLQIKITTKEDHTETPAVFLDGVKVEVLYDSTLEFNHPDFVRDTILNDETYDGVRIVTIINNETNEEEIWYMYLEEATTTESLDAASSTPLAIGTSTISDVSTSTIGTTTDESVKEVKEDVATSTEELAVATTSVDDLSATTTLEIATTTATSSAPVIKPVIPKNKWLKFEKKRDSTLSIEKFVEEIKKIDDEEYKKKAKRDRLPDFAIDIIKRIRGTFANSVIVQLEKDNQEELWLYDLENSKQERIETGSSTTIAKDVQIGVKDGKLFWLSEDKKKLYAYNLATKVSEEKEVPEFDSSNGERARITFEGSVWTVIVGVEGITFFSDETGEVFSDDDGSLAERLRDALKLDTVLDEDTISNLNLQVEASKEKIESQ